MYQTWTALQTYYVFWRLVNSTIDAANRQDSVTQEEQLPNIISEANLYPGFFSLFLAVQQTVDHNSQRRCLLLDVLTF